MGFIGKFLRELKAYREDFMNTHLPKSGKIKEKEEEEKTPSKDSDNITQSNGR